MKNNTYRRVVDAISVLHGEETVIHVVLPRLKTPLFEARYRLLSSIESTTRSSGSSDTSSCTKRLYNGL